MATNNSINNKSEPLTSTTVYATTFDTNVAAAGVTLAGTTLAADGSDAAINITVTPKGTGRVSTAANINAAGISFDSGTTTLANYIATTNFTPEISFAGGQTGITYATQAGSYARIGSVVFFRAYILLTSKGSSTGALRLQNLPVSPTIGSTTLAALLSNVTFTGETLVASTSSSGYITFYYSGNSSEPATAFTDAECDNDLEVRCSGFYLV